MLNPSLVQESRFKGQLDLAGYFTWGVAPASYLLPMMLLSDTGGRVIRWQARVPAVCVRLGSSPTRHNADFGPAERASTWQIALANRYLALGDEACVTRSMYVTQSLAPDHYLGIAVIIIYLRPRSIATVTWRRPSVLALSGRHAAIRTHVAQGARYRQYTLLCIPAGRRRLDLPPRRGSGST